MLEALRRFAGTWPAKIFFLVLVAAFGSWGVADMVRNIGGGGTNVATIEGRHVTALDFQAEFQRDWTRATARFPDPTEVPPAMRQSVASQALSRLVTQQAIAAELDRMHIVAPDASVRQEVFDNPSFNGPTGKFDRGVFNEVLRNNSFTEARFLEAVRADLAQGQLLDTIGAGATPPETLTKLVYSFLNEKRRADYVLLPMTAAAAPAAPAEPVLRRFYANNKDKYTAPEYRRIKLVVLSPDTVARGVAVSDADLHAWFDQHKSEYQSPEKRSLLVVTASSAAVAQDLATIWSAGVAWPQIEAAAKAKGASTASLDDAAAAELPSPELAKAAFAAPLNTVTGPVSEPLGVQLVKVTKITPAVNKGFDELRDTIRGKIAAEKAGDLIDARLQKLQDVFAGGAKIDEVPPDLGAIGAEGTLDARGNTPEGTPAPLPATGALRQAILDAAFKLAKGDPVQLADGPDRSAYAISVEAITPAAAKPFDMVRAQVLADWQRDQQRHTQEALAAKTLALVKSGKTLQDAAWGSGLQVQRTPPIGRDQPGPDVPAEMAQLLFTLKQGEATMVETNKGFLVAVVAEIIHPDPKTDPAGYAQARDQLARSYSQDTEVSYADALRDAAHPTINAKLVETLIAQ